jgi:hypothetical protein
MVVNVEWCSDVDLEEDSVMLELLAMERSVELVGIWAVEEFLLWLVLF